MLITCVTLRRPKKAEILHISPVAETTTITIPDLELFKQKALAWANRFRVVCLLDNNQYSANAYRRQEWILAVDALEELWVGNNPFEELKEFHKKSGAEIFGFLTYDLKNRIEKLSSNNVDGLQFPELYFFKPRYVLELRGNKLTVNRNYPETFELLEHINNYIPPVETFAPVELTARTHKEDYLRNVDHIRTQIEAGDFYEMNYCVEWFAEDSAINPVEIFTALNNLSRAPFSCFFKYGEKYLLCASPERFLMKQGTKLISQPIKGTIKKGSNATENGALKAQLQNDIKERAENVMIVDLVRNDLAHTVKPGTVKVEELFGVYEFNSVNQMISTVTGELENEDIDNVVSAIKYAFPMGSMTGAPKVEVMDNIERYEDFKRGLFSGSVGYITANGDFDLNVVIRSILYNAETKYVSVPVGGAITYDSVGEKEYEEVLLKAKNMMAVLNR